MSRRAEIKKNLKVKSPLPPQLQARVKSGAISGQQARQTLQQRQTLKAAFGDDWRNQVFGKGGAKGASGPFAQRQVAAKRSQALAKAQAKLGGGLGGGKAVERTLRAPVPTLGPRKTKKRTLRY